MKRIFFFVFFIIGISSVYAQSSYYNYQGDQALQKRDYQMALSWFCEGLDSCDRYSIQKLYEIWINQDFMRESMNAPMRICFECVDLMVKAGETEKMLLLSDFYKYGVGTPQDSVLSDYWKNEYDALEKPDTIPEKPNPREDSSVIVKVPRKSLLSNRFCSFLTYTWSPTMPFGFTAGIYFDKLGGYVSGRTDFRSIHAAYECNNTRVPAIDIENPPYEFNRERWRSQMITVGVLCPIVKNRWFLSVGGGYGKREYYREIRSTTSQKFTTGNTSEWCFNSEASYQGLTLEIGSMFIWKKLAVTGGVNSTRFKDLDISIGLGLSF